MAASCGTFEAIPLYLIEITIGQFLLPFERRRIKRLSTSYKDLFNAKTSIAMIYNNASSSISLINTATFWNQLNYLYTHIIQKYFDFERNMLCLTDQKLDQLSNEAYFMLKYLLIYYHDLRQHEQTITFLANANGAQLEWDKVFSLLPQINGLCLKFNENIDGRITALICDTFEFCSNSKQAHFMQILDLYRTGIDDTFIAQWCQSMKSRKNEQYGIVELNLSFNEGITDECMAELFECIAFLCPRLESINLSSTSITDRTCRIIYAFYEEYFGKQHDEVALSLSTINIMRCRGISKNGANLLSAIYMQDWCPAGFCVHSFVESPPNTVGMNV